jgi:hypothetical protein
MRRAASLVVVVFGSSFFGCPPAAPERAPVTFNFPTTKNGEAFLDTPWPSDVMVHKDGTLNLRRFPNPFNSQTLEEFLGIFGTAPGWSRNSTLAFKVDGGVDEDTLPKTPADSIKDDASMFLIELETQRRLPLEWKTYPEGTSFYPPGTVAVNPLVGVVAHGPYALVVTSAAHRKDGVPLGPSDDLKLLLTCGTIDEGAIDSKDVDCAPYQKLVTDLGKDVVDVALVQKVTPQDTLPQFLSGYAAARAYTPVISNVTARPDVAADPYRIYDGTIRLAHFQRGRAPYDTFDGTSGGFDYSGPELVDGAGASPVVTDEEDVAFLITIPKNRARPPEGWPVVINGHGTGGDLESGLGRTPGSEAFHITSAGAAMLAISEPLHNGRDGYREGQENALTFNFFNPLAGRDNWRQSALEKVQLVTAVADLDFTNADGAVETFNENQIGYFGHSQGGIVGGQFVPMETRIRGALLSGAGAGFATSMVEKTDPPPAIADILRLVLSMPDDEEIDLFHPVPAVLQTFVDAADPLNYGAYWQETQKTQARHLLVTSGLKDTFTPKRNHAALAAAFGIPLADPVAEPLIANELLGIDDVGGESIDGNLSADNGDKETVGMVQFADQGHFAVFNDPNGQRMFSEFFTSLFGLSGVPHVRTR